MRKLFICFLSITIIHASCKLNNPDKPAVSADSDFQQLSDSFLLGYLYWRPQTAVGLGLHEYDGKLTDLSKESISKELTRLRNTGKNWKAIDTNALSAKLFYDLRILKLAIKAEIFGIEDLNKYAINPMAYAGLIDVNIYISRNFAPLEDRVKSIIAIENQAPQQFDYAKANLQDSLAKPFVETAIKLPKAPHHFWAMNWWSHSKR